MRFRNTKMITAYKYTIDNTLYLEEKISIKKKIKVLAYNLIGSLLFPHRIDDTAPLTLHVINGKSELSTRHFKKIPELYYGLTFSNWKEIKEQRSHISYIGRSERVKIIFSSILSYKDVKLYGGCYAYWLDFCLWNAYVSKTGTRTLVGNGNYDRLTTTITELCRLYSVSYQMKQHGLISSRIKIPHKIHCEKMYAFDDVQAELFKKHIIENDDCVYENWYKPGFEFVEKKFDKYTIGIIENKSTINKITEIYDILKSICRYGNKNQNVVIMLHPRSKQSEYEELVRDCKCNVTFTREKIFDYDMIVSCPSTLAYDYLRSDYTRPIIFVEFISSLKYYLEAYENVTYIGSADELDYKMAEMLKI